MVDKLRDLVGENYKLLRQLSITVGFTLSFYKEIEDLEEI